MIELIEHNNIMAVSGGYNIMEVSGESLWTKEEPPHYYMECEMRDGGLNERP